MPARLYAGLYNDATYAGTHPEQSFYDPSDVGIRWALPGGVQRIEISFRASDVREAWAKYKDGLGYRLAVFDTYADRPIAGQVYEVVPDGRFITFVCAGPHKRLNDDLYTVTDFGDITIPTDETDTVIKDILDDAVSVEASDQTNIASSGVDIRAWVPRTAQNASVFAGDGITELAAIGDSSNNPMDFYFVDQPFKGTEIQKPLAYFKSRSSTATPDWVFAKADLAPGGFSLSRNIFNLVRDVWIGYGRLTGSATAGSGANLIDSGADFLNDGVTVGDRVVNITQVKTFTVETLTSATELDMNTEDAGNWASSDDYSIQLRELQWTNTGTSTETDLWTVIYVEARPEMDATQAGEYGDMILAQYEKAQQQQAFVIGSQKIQRFNGGAWPLWRPLMHDSFYFEFTDLYPQSSVFDTSDDREQVFMAVAMDYTYKNNRLRIVPSTGDSRLDAILNQARLVRGQLISTEGAGREHVTELQEEGLTAEERAAIGRKYRSWWFND